MEQIEQKKIWNIKQAFHFDWIIPAVIKPRQTIKKIVAEEKPVWLTVLVILSTLIIISVLIAAPIKRNAIQMGMNTPVDYQYYSEEQKSAFASGQANQTSPLFLFVFPLLIDLVKVWLSWFFLSVLLHITLTLSGSRATNIKSYNLAAWSFIPIAIRHIVQMLVMIFSRSAISAQGLSGFIAADASGFAAYMKIILGFIDIYFIWQIVLLIIGVVPLSGLAKSKAWTATAISIVILILIQSIPGVISNALSGISLGGSFYF